MPQDNQYTTGLKRVGPTEEETRLLCEEAEKGSTVPACAGAAGLSHHTVGDWIRKGKPALEKALNGEPLNNRELAYVTFYEQFSRAQSKGCLANEEESVRRAREGLGTWTERWRANESIIPDIYDRRRQEQVQAGPIVLVIEGRPSRELPPEAFVVEGELVDEADQGALQAAPSAASVS